MTTRYDRAAESLGNIVHLEHVNLLIPDQQAATEFYISGLRLTRDPYLMTGTDNMWVNIGRTQMHLPCREPAPQHLRGTIGLVVPDLDAVAASLEKVAPALAGSAFAFARDGDTLRATCPWGNRYHLHEPDARYGSQQLGLVYVALDVPPGAAAGIAAFYEQIMQAPARLDEHEGAPAARVTAGIGQCLLFRETDQPLPDYDGHHVAIYIADFAGPYERLRERDLITMESDAHEWRFQQIVDPDSGAPLYTIEHEVRSVTHPLYARPLVNRNPAQSNRGYARGQDAFPGRL